MEISGLLPLEIGPVVAGLLVAASFFTSAITAAFGVGGGLAMLALLGIYLPVAALIPVHGLVQLGSNTGRAITLRAHVRHDIASPFILGSVAGAIVGLFVVVQLPDAWLKLVLGLFIVAITWTTIPGLSSIGKAGLAAGSAVLAVLSMMLGATGPMLASFFGQMIPNDRKALIATHAAGMTVQHLLKVIVFAIAGFAFAQWLPLVAAMVVSGYLGTVYGARLLDRLPEEKFRFWFKVGLTLLAADMLRQGIAGLL